MAKVKFTQKPVKGPGGADVLVVTMAGSIDASSIQAFSDGTLALAVAGSAQLWRRELADASFMLVWMAFAATAMLTFFIAWTLAALVLEQWPNPWPLVLQTVVNIALYPLLTLLYGRLQSALFD